MKTLCLTVWVLLGFLPSAVWSAPQTGADFSVQDRDLSRPLKIIVYGDMRFTDPHETQATNPTVRRWLVDQIAAEKPDAVLLSGDVVWHGAEANDYAEFASETQSWRDAHLRIYPALGNHEFSGRPPCTPADASSPCLEHWWNTFPKLKGKRWYSVQLGDSVYVLNLDSDLALDAGSPQIAWVRAQLAGLPATVRFVFFNMHHPPRADPDGDDSHSGRSENENAFRAFLTQAAPKSRARFVVAAGHVHNYERFFQDGIYYLVSGGGGAQPYPVDRKQSGDLYQDEAFPNYHFVRIVGNRDALEATMIRVGDPTAASPSWQEKDRFEITPVARAAGAK